jgi:hypothetical protein
MLRQNMIPQHATSFPNRVLSQSAVSLRPRKIYVAIASEWCIDGLNRLLLMSTGIDVPSVALFHASWSRIGQTRTQAPNP